MYKKLQGKTSRITNIKSTIKISKQIEFFFLLIHVKQLIKILKIFLKKNSKISFNKKILIFFVKLIY